MTAGLQWLGRKVQAVGDAGKKANRSSEGGYRLQRSSAASEDRPMITVITVVRCAAGIIERTITSVIEQTYDVVEYIIVDGQSTDGTVDVIRRYEDRIAYWVSEPDRGHADAFNKGIDLATGDTLLFMNAGDTFHDDGVLERIASSPAFARDDLARIIVYADAWGIHDDGERRLRCDHLRLDEECSLCHQATFVGRDVHREHRYDMRMRIGMDYDLWLRCRDVYGVEFVKVDEIVANYRFDGLSCDRAHQVHIHIENEIIRMLNSSGMWGDEDAWRFVDRVLRYRFKKGIEFVVGERIYRALRDVAGRADSS